MSHQRVSALKEFVKDSTPTFHKKESKCIKCERLHHFCRTTANHGFAHIVDTEELSGLKVIWALVICAFTGIVITLLYASVSSLIERKLTTEFLEEEISKAGDGITLPDIHICDTSVFHARKLEEMGFNSTMATYLLLATWENSADEYFLNSINRESLKKEFDRILATNSLSVPRVIEGASIKCEDMILKCEMGDETFNNEICCETFFHPQTYVSIFGSCISTHGKKLNQKYESRDAGLIVYIFPNDNIIEFTQGIVKSEYISQKGLYYAVSSTVDPIKAVLETEGRYAMPNTWVSAPISKTVIDASEVKGNSLAPYTCVDFNDENNRKLKTPDYEYYSKDGCEAAFEQDIYRKHGNCSAIFHAHRDSNKLCDPDTIANFNTDLLEKIPANWCTRQCKQEIFTLSPSSAAYNTEYLQKTLNDGDQALPDMVVLHFFYPSFTYQVQVLHANTYLKFLGEVGGNMGLFLGASLISLLEIVALFLRCCIRGPH